MAIAAVAAGLVALQYAVLPGIALIGRGSAWEEVFAYGAVSLGLVGSFVLLTIAAIRPRSLIAAMGAALTVGLLLMWGMGPTPGSWPRVLLHLAAVLCVVALLIQVTQGILDRRWRVLWILAVLLLGLPIGYLAGGVLGLHIRLQYCRFPLLGPDISSILCSG